MDMDAVHPPRVEAVFIFAFDKKLHECHIDLPKK